MKVPELKGGQMITLLYIAGFAIALFIVYKILSAVGIIKTAKVKRAEKAQDIAISNVRSNIYFDPMYLKGKTSTYKALKDTATTAAIDIHDSIYGFLKIGTNAERIFSIFSSLQNKLNISEVALNYKLKYNRDLRADLINNLSDQHILDLDNMLDKLPNN